MSESRTTCTDCNRPPGGVHRNRCPRSRVSLKLRDAHLDQRTVRYVCPPKGVPMFQGDDRKHVIVNPGIPYVRSTPKTRRGVTKPGKPWYAGGIPHAIRSSPIVREVLNGQRPAGDLLSGRL